MLIYLCLLSQDLVEQSFVRSFNLLLLAFVQAGILVFEVTFDAVLHIVVHVFDLVVDDFAVLVNWVLELALLVFIPL